MSFLFCSPAFGSLTPIRSLICMYYDGLIFTKYFYNFDFFGKMFFYQNFSKISINCHFWQKLNVEELCYFWATFDKNLFQEKKDHQETLPGLYCQKSYWNCYGKSALEPKVPRTSWGKVPPNWKYPRASRGKFPRSSREKVPSSFLEKNGLELLGEECPRTFRYRWSPRLG